MVLAGNHQMRDNIIVGNNRYDLISDRVVFWPEAINHITLEDCSMLMRPYFADNMLGDDFDVLVKYAYELTKGSARKLVDSLIPNALDVYKNQKQKDTDAALTCNWLRTIGKQLMGIQNPPPLPHKPSSIAMPA